MQVLVSARRPTNLSEIYPILDFRANKPSDVISTLVSIYDSKDLFVKELQVLLAQRLLSINDDGVERVEKEVGPFLGFDRASR